MNAINTNIEVFDTHYDDFIHDISFDFFGKRVATCSSDSEIKIWTRKDNKWIKKASFKAHDATIWKVKWAHPDFGNIIATCSYDKTVIIWEERHKASQKIGSTNFMINEEDEEESTWISRAKLLESKESIEDIKFGPKHMGLVIATASADGILRIYECPDLMNLAYFKMIGEVQTNSLGINCISWNKNPFDKPMIIVGSKDQNTSYMTKSLLKVQSVENNAPTIINKNSPLNEDKMLSIYINIKNAWSCLDKVSYQDYSHKSAVNDVSWSQLNGRSYHMIASCGKEGVFLWYMKLNNDDNKTLMNITSVQIINNDNSTTWKCSWNFMGTLLAFSSDDNKVKICKSGFNGNWSVISQFEADQPEAEEEKKMMTSLIPSRYR